MFKLSKKQKVFAWSALSLALMAAVIPFAIWVTHTSSAQVENSRRRCDGKRHAVHTADIKNNQVTPQHTSALLCDTLTITNLDDTSRLIAFGQHDKHISYNGISERLLRQNQSLTITLGHSGSYRFHDHENDAVNGTFTVSYPN